VCSPSSIRSAPSTRSRCATTEFAQGAAALRRERRGCNRRATREVPVDDRPATELHGRRTDLRAASIAKDHPKAKIAVLYENDEYGPRAPRRLKRGLGSHASQIVGTQSYSLLDSNVLAQVEALKATGADTFVIFALPQQAAQAFVAASKLGWKPDRVRDVSLHRPGGDAHRSFELRQLGRRRRHLNSVPARPNEPDAEQDRRGEALSADHEALPAEGRSESGSAHLRDDGRPTRWSTR